MKRILLAATLIFSVNVFANEFDSIEDVIAATAGQATSNTIGGAVGFLYHSAFTKQFAAPGAPTPLTNEIDEIVTATNKTWLKNWGIGALGGAQVTIQYDTAQAARYAGMKNLEALNLAINAGNASLDMAERAAPVFGKAVINTRVSDLRARLDAIKATGASVNKVTIKGLVPRVGGYGVALVQVYFFGVAATDAFAAANLAWQASNPVTAQAWEAGNCQVVSLASGGSETACTQAPNFLQDMLNNSVLAIVIPE
jgi:hypothetical protein